MVKVSGCAARDAQSRVGGVHRATVVEQGSSRAVDSWVFNQGDVWYFPTNLGHIIIGLPGQDNCTYLSAYNQASQALRPLTQGWLSCTITSVATIGPVVVLINA